MSVSDIITIVSLVLAIIAILNEKNRVHLLLKFTKLDFFLFGLCFLLMNYFVFYDSFYARHIFIPQLYFDHFGLKNPKNYGYIITITALSFFFIKIWWSFYPSSKERQVFQFYRKLIENEEVPFLMDLIERYHKNDIILYLKTYRPDEDDFREPYQKRSFKEKFKTVWKKLIAYLFPGSSANRISFARSVLLGTMNDPSFLSLAANKRPHLFAELYIHFTENRQRGFPNELVKGFLKELLYNKNFWLIKELKESQNHDSGQPEWFFDQNPIIGGLLLDMSVAHANNVWQPFGDIAIDEIEEERLYGYESKFFTEYREDQFLWEYRIFLSIQFFFILLAEAIIKNYKSHFWIQYYSIFVKTIVKTLEKYPNKKDVNTSYHRFIELIIDRLIELINLANRKGNVETYQNLIQNLGWCINSVTETEVFPLEKTKDFIESVLTLYCDLEPSESIDNYRTELIQILIKPASYSNNIRYKELLKDVWEGFDKIPHYNHEGDLDYFAKLKKEVIDHLND